MDFIEKYFKKHKDEFEYIHPDSTSWENLENELFPSESKKVPVYLNLFKIAALLAVGLFAAVLYLNKENNTHAELVGLEENMLFPDVSLRNPDGEAIALSSLKGKVVLVEFWASYCMVCTEEHCYYFKPLYNTFKDKGFEIYSVSIDSSANNWLKMIDKNELDWIQVSDLMGTDSPISKQFAVNALPTNYLLDQDGKIIAKNVDVSKLEETLPSILAYKE